MRKTNANINSTTKAHTHIKQNMKKVTPETAIMTKLLFNQHLANVNMLSKVKFQGEPLQRGR